MTAPPTDTTQQRSSRDAAGARERRAARPARAREHPATRCAPHPEQTASARKRGVLRIGFAGAFSVLLAASVAAQETSLRAVRVAGASTLVDLSASFWAEAPAVAVTMLPQVVTTPRHPVTAVKQLEVKAAHNGQWLAFLIAWADPTKDDRLVTNEFGDQVAVELPVKYDPAAPPSPMMGNAGGRVLILQWRAAFQRDLERHDHSVRDLYPYAQVDVYPDEVLRATDARPYTGALGLDNPISQPLATPVLDQMAEGWGTLTVKPEQHSDGKGLWHDGQWQVVITHPMASGSDDDPQVQPGDTSVAAFAVWDGGNAEVGARKAWSSWIPIRFE